MERQDKINLSLFVGFNIVIGLVYLIWKVIR
jgi:hypothetical protein